MRITVANRLSRKDSSTGLDVWYKTVIDGAYVKKDKVSTVVGTDVSMGEAYIILIPFSDDYRHYEDWSDRDSTYTMNQGDVIFLGEIDEDITPNNISRLRSAQNSCEVRTVEERTKKYGVEFQLRVSGV